MPKTHRALETLSTPFAEKPVQAFKNSLKPVSEPLLSPKPVNPIDP